MSTSSLRSQKQLIILLLSLLFSLLFSNAVLADVGTGLVGYWKFDETSGTTANATTGGVNGNLTNFQASPWLASPDGKIDGALLSNNVNNTRIELGDNFDFDGTSSFTLSIWIYRVSTSGNVYQSMISKILTDGNGRQGWTFGVCNGCGTTDRGFACERYLDGTNKAAVDLSGDVPLNTWVHAACTFDGNRVRIYRNGVFIEQSGNAAQSLINHAGSAFIGNQNGNTLASPLYNGSPRARMDEVRIYNRALSAAEIMTLANPCTSGSNGVMEYFSDATDKRLRYCNSTYWESMTNQAAGAACANAGEWSFDSTNNVMQFCNGTNYYRMGPTSAGGAGCSSPTGSAGALYYDSTNKVYKYCSGAAWVSVGT